MQIHGGHGRSGEMKSHTGASNLARSVHHAKLERPHRTQAYPVSPDLLPTSQNVRGKTNSCQTPFGLLFDALRASPTRLSLLCVIPVPHPFLATVSARWILTDLVAVAFITVDSPRYAFRSAGEAMALSASPNSKHHYQHRYRHHYHDGISIVTIISSSTYFHYHDCQ